MVVSCPTKNRQSHNNSIINLHALTCQLNAPVPHSSGVAGDSCDGYDLTAPTLKVFRRRHHKVFIVRIVCKVYTYSDHTHTCGPPAKLSMTRAQHISRKNVKFRGVFFKIPDLAEIFRNRPDPKSFPSHGGVCIPI